MTWSWYLFPWRASARRFSLIYCSWVASPWSISFLWRSVWCTDFRPFRHGLQWFSSSLFVYIMVNTSKNNIHRQVSINKHRASEMQLTVQGVSLAGVWSWVELFFSVCLIEIESGWVRHVEEKRKQHEAQRKHVFSEKVFTLIKQTGNTNCQFCDSVGSKHPTRCFVFV